MVLENGIKTVIMAGGKGTRIVSINSKVPKPMIPILEKPILEYQIESLREQGLTDITIAIGYLGHKIKEYFGNGNKISPATGKSFGVNIEYIVEEEPLGTAGVLFYLKDVISKDFLLINGDVIFDIDIERLLQFHKRKKSIATLFTHPNHHPYDSGIIITNEDSQVTNWLHKEDERKWYKNRVNAGIHVFSPKIFDDELSLGLFTELKKMDLDREVLKPLIPSGLLYAYDSPEYVMDMGTPDRLDSVTEDIRTEKVKAKNLKNKQKAFFLDRDGTINTYVGFLKNINDFQLINGVAEAVKKMNQSGYLVIVVTNQPVIARGEVSLKELQEIHNKMETLLGEHGAYVDAIYFCPHHPHKGFEGERSEYKIDCECRKPKSGMIKEAAEMFNIDLSQSFMIGDSENDMEAGKTAGCKLVYIGKESFNIANMKKFNNLQECADRLLNQELLK